MFFKVQRTKDHLGGILPPYEGIKTLIISNLSITKEVMKLFYHIDKECSRFIIYQNVIREVYDKEKHVYLFIFITSIPFSSPYLFLC